MRKRKRGRSRGRKVILRVMKVPNQKNEKFHYLTALRTRVKKTRWQKISLPVTLIQSMLDSKDNALNLRISCKHCGRMVRPVLFQRENKNFKNGKIRKRKGKGKGKRRRRRRRMRNKRTNENNRIQPFLVISTRYRHTFKQSWYLFLILISYCVHKEFWKTSYRISVTGRDSNITGLRRMKERAFDFFTYEDYQARFIFLFQNGYLRFPTFEEFSRTTVTLWFKLVMTPSRMGPLEQVLVQTYYMSKTNEVCNLLINVVIKKALWFIFKRSSYVHQLEIKGVLRSKGNYGLNETSWICAWAHPFRG